MPKKIVRFFDLWEDSIRARFSQHPIAYSIFGGIGVVLFWRGVWETADLLSRSHIYFEYFFYPPFQIIISAIGLLMSGLMVSAFIGHRILLSGLRHEKKLEEDTDQLVKEEVITLAHIRQDIRELRKDLEAMKVGK